MNDKITLFKKASQALLIAIAMIFSITVGKAQTLSFTTSSNTLTKSGITVTNQSTNIPSGYRFKWEVSGGKIYCDSIGIAESSFEKNNSTFIIYPINKYNSSSESYTITLKLMNQQGEVQNTTPYNESLIYSPLVYDPQDCFGNTPIIPCNIICNSGFEFITGAGGPEEIANAYPWISGIYDPNSNAYLNASAELYTLNNQFMGNLWSSGKLSGVPLTLTAVQNFGGSQLPSASFPSNNNYAGFISSTSNGYSTLGSPISQEFIATKLTSNLLVGNDYSLSFEYSLGEISKRATNFKAVIVYSNLLTGTEVFNALMGNSGYAVTELNPNMNNQSDLSVWQSYNGTFTAPANPSNLDAYLIISGGGTSTNITNISGSAQYNLAYYFIDNVTIIPKLPSVTLSNTNFNVQCDDEITINTTNPQNVNAYQWNLPNGQAIAGANSSSITFHPIITGIYTLVVTNSSGCSSSYPINITVTPKTDLPVILGVNNLCTSTSISYSIGNYNNQWTYNWSIINSSYGLFNNSANTGQNVQIDWINVPVLPGYAEVKVIGMSIHGCTSEGTLKVFQCCEMDSKDEDLSNSTIISSTTFNGKRVLINGTLNINNNVTFTASTNGSATVIDLGPEAKIIVKSGATLTINQGTVLEKSVCDYMWDKIELSDGATLIMDNSTLKHSINGIISKDATSLTLTNNHFYDNYKSVQIFYPDNVLYTQDYGGVITNCIFETNPDALNTTTTTAPASNSDYLLIIPPMVNKEPELAIYAKNVYGFNIGNQSTVANQFAKLKNGITLENTKATIVNNSFKYIKNVSNILSRLSFDGAIRASGLITKPTVYLKNLVIGGNSTTQKNYFENCNIGINTLNYYNNITYNEFKNCNSGIITRNFLNFSPYSSAISYNKFYDVIKGIQSSLTDVQNRGLTINENIFYGPDDNNIYSSVMKVAIDVSNFSSGKSYPVNITKNKIRFKDQRSSATYGIMAQFCNGININTNSIERSINGVSVINNDWEKTKGIWISSSTMANLTNNCITGMGQGIYTSGDLQKTQFTCNDIRVAKYGFGFGLNSALSDQGADAGSGSGFTFNPHDYFTSMGSIPNNNYLDDHTPNNIILTGGVPVKWFYGPSFANSNYMPNDVLNSTLSGLMIDATQNSNSYHRCVSLPCSNTFTGSGTLTGEIEVLNDPDLDAEVRDALLQSLVDGQQYSELNNEYRQYDDDFLYGLLKENNTLIWLGDVTDDDYYNFLTQQATTNTGKFYDVYQYIENRNFEQASILNNSISVNLDNVYLNNLKTVLAIYLDSWCKDRFELTEDEYNTLFNIADQTPYRGGKAVYQARLMIGYDVDEHPEVGYRIGKANSTANDESIRLFPNPANDKVNIEFTNDGTLSKGELKIYSITGKLIFETEFITDKSLYEIPVNTLLNGVYLFDCKINNSTRKAGKLVILK